MVSVDKVRDVLKIDAHHSYFSQKEFLLPLSIWFFFRPQLTPRIKKGTCEVQNVFKSKISRRCDECKEKNGIFWICCCFFECCLRSEKKIHTSFINVSRSFVCMLWKDSWCPSYIFFAKRNSTSFIFVSISWQKIDILEHGIWFGVCTISIFYPSESFQKLTNSFLCWKKFPKIFSVRLGQQEK